MNKLDFSHGWTFAKEGGVPKPVRLPHDAMFEEKRNPGMPKGQGHGFFPGGKYVYEKTFHIQADWAGKAVLLEFEAVYRNVVVYINGTKAGGRPYGYIPFFMDAAPFLTPGGMNNITVTVDNSETPNSRWYCGSGIIRPVWQHVGNAVHIPPEGVKVTTLSYSPSRIRVDVEHTGGEVSVEIIDHGKVVASGISDSVEVDIPNAKLWSDETPYLYECRVKLIDGGAIVDETTVPFGIRKIEWSPRGLFVNGRETKLRGGCLHHDNGLLGAVSVPEAEERRARKLKEYGFNAIRSAHNPASPALLDACDRLGLYVMDETWDMWYKPKTAHDYALQFMDNYKDDIAALVRRDYNHPSVIMYSIGNEVSEPCEDKGVELAKELIDLFHQHDGTRPVTMGLNLMILHTSKQGMAVSLADAEKGAQAAFQMPPITDSTMFNMMASMMGAGMNNASAKPEVDASTSPVLDALDIAGYNYADSRYPLDGALHPDRVIVGSETFPMSLAKNWAMVKQYPYLIGDFMWTAWDYLGEAGIGAWAYTTDGATFDKPYPWLLGDVGAFDILGDATAEAGYAAIIWGAKPIWVSVQPINHPGVIPAKGTWRGSNAIASWAWEGCEGNPATVEVYADATEAELFLNGESLGRQPIVNCRAVFETTYTLGILIAAAYDAAGNETARISLLPPEGKLHIQVEPEVIATAPGTVVFVDVSIVHKNGVVECNHDIRLTAAVEGGSLLGFGSANPRTEENYLDGTFTTYYGRAQAIVRVGETGTASIQVKGEIT